MIHGFGPDVSDEEATSGQGAGVKKRVAIAAAVALTTAAGAIPLVSAAPPKKPDLVVTMVVAPAQAEAGDQISLSDTTKNKGTKVAGASQTGYFLSVDAVKDNADTQLTGKRRVPKLNPRKSSVNNGFAVTVPASVDPGDYRVIACADVTSKVSERSETNNCKATAGTIQVGDFTAPGAPTLQAPQSPANDTTPAITGTGEPGSTVTLYATGNCSGTAAGTDTADSSGNVSFEPTVSPNSTTSFSAKAVDAGGNTSNCSNSVSYTENSTAPAAPTGLTLSPAGPANNNNPQLTGNAQAGSTVSIFTTADCSGPALATVTATGGTFSYMATVADNSTTTFTATASNETGNNSACSSSITYAEDSAGPAAPTGLAMNPASPANDETPRVTGNAETGSIVAIFKSADCSGASAGTGTATGGTFDIEITVPNNSTTTFTARATDAAGNTGACSSSITYVEDSATPAPSNLGTNPASPANDETPSVTGSAEAGSTVSVYTTPDCTGAVGGSGTANGGTFSIEVTVPNGSTTTFTARAVDGLGNTSTCSSSISYVEQSVTGPLQEIEPNNSRADAETVSASNPNLVLNADRRISASISPAGDQDFFKVVSPGPERVARFETLNTAGTDCDVGGLGFTALTFQDADGTTLTFDQNSGLGACSAITREIPSPGTSYLVVEHDFGDEIISGYQLRTEYLENAGSESEDNGSIASADPVAGTQVVVSGNHQLAADVDFFSITVPQGASLRLETIEAGSTDPAFETCESNGADSQITVTNAAGTSLATNDDGGRGFCSMLDGRGGAPQAPGLSGMGAGTYYVKVDAGAPGTAGIFNYRLAISIE